MIKHELRRIPLKGVSTNTNIRLVLNRWENT